MTSYTPYLLLPTLRCRATWPVARSAPLGQGYQRGTNETVYGNAMHCAYVLLPIGGCTCLLRVPTTHLQRRETRIGRNLSGPLGVHPDALAADHRKSYPFQSRQVVHPNGTHSRWSGMLSDIGSILQLLHAVGTPRRSRRLCGRPSHRRCSEGSSCSAKLIFGSRRLG